MVIFTLSKEHHELSRRATQHTACLAQQYCPQTKCQVNYSNKVIRLWNALIQEVCLDVLTPT